MPIAYPLRGSILAHEVTAGTSGPKSPGSEEQSDVEALLAMLGPLLKAYEKLTGPLSNRQQHVRQALYKMVFRKH